MLGSWNYCSRKRGWVTHVWNAKINGTPSFQRCNDNEKTQFLTSEKELHRKSTNSKSTLTRSARMDEVSAQGPSARARSPPWSVENHKVKSLKLYKLYLEGFNSCLVTRMVFQFVEFIEQYRTPRLENICAKHRYASHIFLITDVTVFLCSIYFYFSFLHSPWRRRHFPNVIPSPTILLVDEVYDFSFQLNT